MKTPFRVALVVESERGGWDTDATLDTFAVVRIECENLTELLTRLRALAAGMMEENP